MKVKREITTEFFQDNPFKVVDWLIFSVLALLCFFAFEHEDIIHTATGALGYLQGHVLDFYEYGDSLISGMNYMPSTFLVFAIWNIPLYLLGIVTEPTMAVSVGATMWFKLLPVLVYFGSGAVLYKIAREMDLSVAVSKAVMYIFYTAPIGFFSQFIFGQYDIFTVFFILLGFYAFLKKDIVRFLVFFAIAVTFKYFALLFFLPLAMLWEKDIKKLFFYLVAVFAPLALESLIYIGSPVFRSDVLGFQVAGYIGKANLGIFGDIGINITIAGWVFVCGWAYFTQVNKKSDVVKWSVYFCNLVACLVFCFFLWHPQWLLLAVPFWTLGTVISKKRNTFFWLDIIIYIVFLMYVVNIFPQNVDQTLFSGGVLRDFYYASGVTMARLFIFNNASMLLSLFVGSLIVYSVFKHPKYAEADLADIDIKPDRNILRGRFVFCVLLFIIPAAVCLYGGIKNDTMAYEMPPQPAKSMDEPLSDDYRVGQVFLADNEYITAVEFKVDNLEKVNSSDFTLVLMDWETKEEISSLEIDSETIITGNNYFDFPETRLEKGHPYCLMFMADGKANYDDIVLMRGWRNNQFTGYCVVNDEKTDYDVYIRVYGK